MTQQEILTSLESLSYSQGFYSRLYGDLMTLKAQAPDEFERMMRVLENQNFNDIMDLIRYFEC